MGILLEIIIEILCGIAALISAISGVVLALVLALCPAYLMFHVSPWFVLIYIGYIIMIFVYLALKKKYFFLKKFDNLKNF